MVILYICHMKQHLIIYKSDREDGGFFGRVAIPCEHTPTIKEGLESIRDILESPEFITKVSNGLLFYMCDMTAELENTVVTLSRVTIGNRLCYEFTNCDGERVDMEFDADWLEVYE